MRVPILIMALFFLCPPCLRAQQDTVYRLSRSIQADIADFSVDYLGNIYLLTHNNQLRKLDPNGDSLGVYNAVSRFGDITYMDVTNPLKILLYYRDFATIVETDRFLNILNTIDLRGLGIFQAKAIGLAYDNNIWIFDELDARLKRIADDGTILDQTTDFRQLFDTIPDPSMITDQGGLVYLYDSLKGVYIFDHYGTLKNHSPLKAWSDFTVLDKNMVGHNDINFLKFQLGMPGILQEPLPANCQQASKIKLTQAGLYVLKKNILEIYSRR